MTIMITGAGTPDAGGQTVDYTQDFEGAGTPAGWTTGNVDFDDTVAPDLEGSEDAKFDNAEYAYYTFSAASSKYVTFYWYIDEDIESIETFLKYEGSGTEAQFYLLTDNSYRCLAIGGSTNDGGSWAAATTNKIKVHYAKGTGANAVATIWTWNGSSWDLACTSTNGTQQDDITIFSLNNNTDTEIIEVDYFKLHSSDITSPD
jgi:hypothetical protein